MYAQLLVTPVHMKQTSPHKMLRLRCVFQPWKTSFLAWKLL